MSVNEMSVRSILRVIDVIKPYNWSAFELDAYEQVRACLLEPKSLVKPLKIKTNAVQLLHKKLANDVGMLRDVVSVGSMGEPYDKQETHYGLTRGLIQALYDYHFPLHLVTASEGVLRDLDLLEKISKESFLHISVPIVLNHELYERFYPEESFTEVLSLIRHVRLALPKVYISAKILPVLPTLGDDEVSLESMLKALKRVGVDGVSLSLYELFNVKQTQIFLDTIQDFPEFVERFVQRFSLEVEDGLLVQGCAEVKEKDRERFFHKTEMLLKKYQLDSPVPRYIPEDFRHSNYLLAQRLFVRAKHYEDQGQESESIRDIAQKIQSMSDTVSKRELLDFAKNEKVKRDIDYFLFNKELKTFGQAKLFDI